MIEAMILVCGLALGAERCDEQSADDVIRVKVEPVVCAMGSESALAGMAGERAQGRLIKIVCGRRD